MEKGNLVKTDNRKLERVKMNFFKKDIETKNDIFPKIEY